MKFTTGLAALALIAGVAGAADAQSDNHAAPGVVAPNSPRLQPNGDVSPAPSTRANGGVGGTENAFSGTQTRSGGPAGGNNTQGE